jgi:hypothetical protein
MHHIFLFDEPDYFSYDMAVGIWLAIPALQVILKYEPSNACLMNTKIL